MTKLSKREYSKFRRNFEKEILSNLKLSLKASGWKKTEYFFWLVENDYFWTLVIKPYLNADKTRVELHVKPMCIDPILWDILDIQENKKAPKSFRYNGAFTCSSLPLSEVTYDDDIGVKSLCEQIKSWVDREYSLAKQRITEQCFSKHIEGHENQKEIGAYAVSLVCSLISEGELAQATKTANNYETGYLKSVFSMTNTDGNSFHYHALKMIQKINN